MRGPRRALAALLAGIALAALGTYLAAERTEVAVLRTTDAGGIVHETKLWVVDVDGATWVRVAHPARAWFERLRANPDVELVRSGVARPYRAVAMQDPGVRERVDAAFAAKYGVTDWWYGLLVRRDPVPVRLDPIAGPREAGGP
jgi:hypothetical protein